MASEKRLIDANALMEEVKRCFAPPKTLPTVFSVLGGIVKNAPTVDAVEVVHGRWDKVKQDLGDGIKTYRFGCSECGYLKNTLTGNYCPNCGAKMDGDGNG